MNANEKHKLFSELGYIKKWLEGIDDKLKTLNGTTAANAKAIQKHEVFIGKIGLITAGIAFVASVIFAAIINTWIKFWK